MDEFAAPMGMENHAAPPEGEVIQGTAMDIDDDKSNVKLIPEEWKGQTQAVYTCSFTSSDILTGYNCSHHTLYLHYNT